MALIHHPTHFENSGPLTDELARVTSSTPLEVLARMLFPNSLSHDDQCQSHAILHSPSTGRSSRPGQGRSHCKKSADSPRRSVCHALPAAIRPVWAMRAGPPSGGPVRSSSERTFALQGHRGRHQQNILFECSLTSRPRAGSGDASKQVQLTP